MMPALNSASVFALTRFMRERVVPGMPVSDLPDFEFTRSG